MSRADYLGVATSSRDSELELTASPIAIAVMFGLACCAGLLICLGGIAWAGEPASTALAHRDGPEELQRMAEAVDNGHVGVVIIGDSRTKFGIESNSEMSELLTRNQQPVHVVRLFVSGGVWANFEDLTDDILQARPSLVLVQGDILYRQRRAPADTIDGRKLFQWQVSDRPLPFEHVEERGCETTLSGRSPADQINHVRRMWNVLELSYGDEPNTRLIEFAEVLEDTGAIFGLLTFPEASYAAPLERPAIDPGNWPQIGGGITISADLFCDYSHLNPDGRERYVDALIPEIHGLLDNSPSPERDASEGE